MAVFPTTPGFKSLGLISDDPTLMDITNDGTHNVRKTGKPQRYATTIRWNRLKEADFAPVGAFIEALRGRLTTFTIVLPIISTPQGVGGGSPQVVGAGPHSGFSLPIDGCPVSTTGWLKTGDVFKLAGHNKVYRLAADVDTDAGGAVTLTFVQPLEESPGDNEALTITDVPFTMRRASDAQQFDLDTPDRFDFELDMVEAA